MAQANDDRQILYQNLLDAGCSGTLMEECMQLAEQGNYAATLQRLSIQRNNLLDEIHSGQDALDCLDYLIYQIQKKISE